MSLRARILYPSVILNKAKVATALKGKTILVTGASFGIGEVLVRTLFEYEVTLILVARTTAKLLALKNESLGRRAKVTTFHCDFYSEKNISELCIELKSIPIDYFISNAGKSIMRSLRESVHRRDDYRRTMAVNYLAPVQLMAGLSESFQNAGTHIVNVSTYNVLMRTPPGWSAYVSSKKAMHSWLEGNIPELTSMNITVSNIYLPLVESRMKEANRTYAQTPAMSMDTAVAIIVKALLNKNYHFKPWWHVPFQVLLFLASPWWHVYWSKHIKRQK